MSSILKLFVRPVEDQDARQLRKHLALQHLLAKEDAKFDKKLAKKADLDRRRRGGSESEQDIVLPIDEDESVADDDVMLKRSKRVKTRRMSVNGRYFHACGVEGCEACSAST